jgi:hypothetical protein
VISPGVAPPPISHCDSCRLPGILALGTRGGSVRSWRFRRLGAVRHPRQSTLALTVADRQYTAVARPTRLSSAPDEARSLLTNDPHRMQMRAFSVQRGDA